MTADTPFPCLNHNMNALRTYMVDTVCLVKALTNLRPQRLSTNASCVTTLYLTQTLGLAKFTFFIPAHNIQLTDWFNKTVVLNVRDAEMAILQ